MAGGRPPSLPFVELTLEWALNVAYNFLWIARLNSHPSLVLHELWLTTDMALCVRHARGEYRLGARFGKLDVDPTTQGPAISSQQQASFFFHSLYDTPPVRAWKDVLGYEWWGEAPTHGWRDGLAQSSRALTVLSLTDQ